MSRLEVPAAFWIWKAVVELAAFWARKLPLAVSAALKVVVLLKPLLPVKV